MELACHSAPPPPPPCVIIYLLLFQESSILGRHGASLSFCTPPPVCHHLPPSLPGELCTGQTWSSPVIIPPPPPPPPRVIIYLLLFQESPVLGRHGARLSLSPPRVIIYLLLFQESPVLGRHGASLSFCTPPPVSSFTSFSSRRALYWADMELACNSAASHCSRSSMMTSWSFSFWKIRHQACSTPQKQL